MTIEKFTRTVESADDWHLILDACHYAHKITSLSFHSRNILYRTVWAESDGYGERGYVPAQGYDWSGIRDSSDKAIRAMALSARGWFVLNGIKGYTVEVTSF